MKYLNNLHYVANKPEISQFKKDWVDMFSAYMREVNFKVLLFWIYFTNVSV
jgi:hypothetical protein